MLPWLVSDATTKLDREKPSLKEIRYLSDYKREQGSEFLEMVQFRLIHITAWYQLVMCSKLEGIRTCVYEQALTCTHHCVNMKALAKNVKTVWHLSDYIDGLLLTEIVFSLMVKLKECL